MSQDQVNEYKASEGWNTSIVVSESAAPEVSSESMSARLEEITDKLVTIALPPPFMAFSETTPPRAKSVLKSDCDDSSDMEESSSEEEFEEGPPKLTELPRGNVVADFEAATAKLETFRDKFKIRINEKIFRMVCEAAELSLADSLGDHGDDCYLWFHLAGFVTICRLKFPDYVGHIPMTAEDVDKLDELIKLTIDILNIVQQKDAPPSELMTLVAILFQTIDDFEHRRADKNMFNSQARAFTKFMASKVKVHIMSSNQVAFVLSLNNKFVAKCLTTEYELKSREDLTRANLEFLDLLIKDADKFVEEVGGLQQKQTVLSELRSLTIDYANAISTL